MIGFVGNPSHFEDRFGDQIVIRFVRFFIFFPSWPRSLDTDLGAVLKAAEPFEWERIPFILEVRPGQRPIAPTGNIVIWCFS